MRPIASIVSSRGAAPAQRVGWWCRAAHSAMAQHDMPAAAAAPHSLRTCRDLDREDVTSVYLLGTPPGRAVLHTREFSDAGLVW